MPASLNGQTDEDPPDTPVFTYVTINPTNGRTEMIWISSHETDVAGYVIYRFNNGEGYAIDTIYNPTATSFDTLWPYKDIRPESYVIASIDSSGNISPLSNELNTIYEDPVPDTCNKKINIHWNKYLSKPVKVTGYDVFASVNGGIYYLAGHVTDDITNFEFKNIADDTEYCFTIKAALENGLGSVSNKSCDVVEMQNPPDWINADYATVTEEGEISLSFSIDPGSEIDLFALERRDGYSGQFNQIAQIPGTEGEKVTYTDKTIRQDAVYFYKLSAVNNCNIKSVTSNIASNIVVNTQNAGNEIVLRWNKYQAWLGSVASYRIFMDTGNGFNEKAVTTPSDTTYSIYLPSVMYTLTQGKVCFYISASESGNPYGITGESVSDTACISIEETVTVPNIFSPDGDGINDLFKPVITFAPSSYQLLITDRHRKTIFETRNYNETWNGSANGSSVSQGVYLWFLKLTTPSGKNITRTGTLTVIKTR